MVKKLLTLCAVAIIAINTTHAQTSTQKWAVGFHVGVEQYKGELGSGFYKFGEDLNGLVGIDFSRFLTPHFDAVFNMTYGDMGYNNGTDLVVFNRQNLFQFNVQGRYNILTDASKWRPYLFVGFGHARFAEGNDTQGNTIIPYGLGLGYQINPNIALRLQETFIYSDFDRMDADPSKNLNDSYLQHSIALVFNFGKSNDADGDGIADDKDACPNIAGSKAANGCPDADGDGVPDAEDKCPNLAGSMAANGCPDADGDGVADKDDKCPNLAGVPENDGCPKINDADQKVLNSALHGINFKTGKDIIEESSYPILDNVVTIMNANKLFNLSIEGHTDSQGNDELNMNLSEKRAQAVKAYLVKNGIAESRLTATGYGETKPIADNSTAEGRAENRRVELKIKFK